MGAIKLSPADWDELAKTVEVTLGGTIIEIKPIGVNQMSLLIDNINEVMAASLSRGITLATIEEKPLELFKLLLDKAPSCLEVVTGVHRDDIVRLPIAKAIEVLRAVVEVNLGDPNALAENFNALIGLIGRVNFDVVKGIANE